MNCSVCNRSFAVTLSICPACGAMMNDSVRQELEAKVLPSKPLRFETRGNAVMLNKPSQPLTPKVPKPESEKPTAPAEVLLKPKTPNLVEFQSKNAALPEWRLQLQNAVRKRQEEKQFEDSSASKPILRTNGATALKADPIEDTEPARHSNPTVASALRRIETSRRHFLTEEEENAAKIGETESASKKDYPFYIASRNNETTPKAPAAKNPPTGAAKPILAAAPRNENGDFDTNKLPPLAQLTESAATTETPAAAAVLKTEPVKVSRKIEFPKKEEVITEIIEVEEADDYASFAMRFNAGLFDLIIGSFASFLLLSPFMLLSGNWMTVSGLFAFLATTAIVMFIYLTTAIGLFGRTFGMRLFSLEVIDIEEEDYPTLHQAAVSSSVYLLSLAVGGLGFLPALFNEEKRAVHDIVSGTMIVKEI